MDGDSIEIRSSKFGKGLFAIKNIEPGTVVCKVSGNEKQLNLYETTLLKEKESHAIQVEFDKYFLCEPPFVLQACVVEAIRHLAITDQSSERASP